ncbi:MAG: SDR family oxidoreductase [Pseudomonadota bacterium]|nr:SDR family oxidoreductase [Pseudomonadota bacterium]MEC8620569.1 SDR family oxidoreductase [Pseudomonadota bacterium]
MPCLVITGASSGIGLATAAVFIESGYTVINLSRSACDVDGVTNITCDLADPNFLPDIETTLLAGIAEADTLCLVHNAARLAHDCVAEISPEELRNVYEINLIAPTVLNRTLLPSMSPGSSILYVGSTLGEKAVPGSFSYVTSKHASIGMMRATCQDLAGSGVHTACINPGFTDTEMLRDHIPADLMAEIAQMSAYGRLIEPSEIARTLLFAAQTPVINGSVMNANLGQIER